MVMGEKEVERFIRESIERIRERVGQDHALVACSGGVDSVVTAVLAHRAIGDQLQATMLDTGLMRKDEVKTVKNSLEKLGIELHTPDISEEMFTALAGITDGEKKRIAFRDTFYRALGSYCQSAIPSIEHFFQGTNRADIKETVGRIKTQHNVLAQIGVKPTDYGLPASVIEPLEGLYKDEIRQVARALGLPEELCIKMPFPGPGLAVRVVGEVTRERVEKVRKATSIVEKTLASDQSIFQAFAVLLNDKATGIRDGYPFMGDIIVIRVVSSDDAVTAKVLEVPWLHLKYIEQEIINKIPSAVRILFELTGKEPATIEYL